MSTDVLNISQYDPQLLTGSDYNMDDIPPIPWQTVVRCLSHEQYGDAELFSIIFSGKCVKDRFEDCWYIYQGHYWKKDTADQMMHLVCGVLASVYIRASIDLNVNFAKKASSETLDLDNEEIGLKTARGRIKALQTRARQLMNLDRMKSVLTMAGGYLRMERRINGKMELCDWDEDSWLIGTADGVIELKNGGRFRAGKPDDYIRTIAPAKWRGLNEPCTRFEQFLREIFADRSTKHQDDIIGFLHRSLGYGATGEVRDHIFLLLYGDHGRNGKDTLMTTLRATLGDLMGPVSNDVLLSPGRDTAVGSAKPHIMQLQGKRLTYASEPSKGSRFDVGQVKWITGGGEITGRNLYEKPRTFKPSHLLVLLTNHKPHADASDVAFWQRLCPITFNLKFVDNPTKPNERLIDTSLSKTLESEISGILAWLVRGCIAWQEHGLQIPQIVLDARKEYQQEEDTLGMFLSETTVEGPNYKVAAGAKLNGLYAVYKDWCDENTIKPLTGTSFGKEIQKLYQKSSRTSEGYFYMGLGLQSVYGPPKEKSEDDIMLEEMHNCLDHHKDDLAMTLQSTDGQDRPLNGAETVAQIEAAFKGAEKDKEWARHVCNTCLPVWRAWKTELAEII